MNTKYLLVALIAVVSTSTMFGYRVIIQNSADESIEIEVRSYAKLTKTEGRIEKKVLGVNESVEYNFGLNNTSYVKIVYKGNTYTIDTKKYVESIFIPFYTGGKYEVHSAGRPRPGRSRISHSNY